MKYLLCLFLLISFCIKAQTNGVITLAWTASTSETGDTNNEFYVLHGSTNVSLALIIILGLVVFNGGISIHR
jgi:hypothetical protein